MAPSPCPQLGTALRRCVKTILLDLRAAASIPKRHCIANPRGTVSSSSLKESVAQFAQQTQGRLRIAYKRLTDNRVRQREAWMRRRAKTHVPIKLKNVDFSDWRNTYGHP